MQTGIKVSVTVINCFHSIKFIQCSQKGKRATKTDVWAWQWAVIHLPHFHIILFTFLRHCFVYQTTFMQKCCEIQHQSLTHFHTFIHSPKSDSKYKTCLSTSRESVICFYKMPTMSQSHILKTSKNNPVIKMEVWLFWINCHDIFMSVFVQSEKYNAAASLVLYLIAAHSYYSCSVLRKFSH